MIKKQNLWFLTLFSLVLVLSIYYITMPSELFTTKSLSLNNSKSSFIKNEETLSTIKESELLVTMRVNLQDERKEKLDNLRQSLTDENTTSDEKNNAYEQIKYITNLSVQEELLENKIKQEFSIDTFIKIDDNKIRVTAISEKHDIDLVNQMMKSIQKEFNNKVSISITFEK